MTTSRTITSRALTLSYLDRQLLLRRSPLSVPEAVRHLVGLQAQYSPSPHLALAARLAGFDRADLHAALTTGSVLKATLMRGTLHLVAADRYADIAAPLRDASLRYWRRTWTGPGIDEAAITGGLAAFLREPRRNDEVIAEVGRLSGGLLTGRGARHTVKALVPMIHVPPSGFWRMYGAATVRAWPDALPDPGEAVARFVGDYLLAYGPASRADIAAPAKLSMKQVDQALAALAPDRHTAEDGRDLYDLPGAPWPGEDVPAPPRLLPKWDAALLSHADRQRILPDELRRRVISAANGDVLSTYLLDGLVAGEWRVERAGDVVTATLTPFVPGPAHGDPLLEEEALRTARWIEPDAKRAEVVLGP